MKLRQTISLILACMMAAVQPSSIVYASDIENNITQESVGDVGSNTENVEDINESTEAVNENESVEISDDTQSNDTENSMEENTANQQDNGTVEDENTDDIFSDGSTGNNLSASEDYLSDLTVRDNDNKDDNTNNEVKNLLSADVILPNGQTDKVTVSRKNGFNEGDKLIVNYLEGEELDKCINGINDTKNANQDSKNDSDVEIDSILPLHMVIADANGNEIQGEENYEIKISEANTNSAEFFKNLKLFHQKQTGEWEEISWNTGNDAETGLTFIDWTSQNLGNFVFVKEKVQSVKNEEADVTVEDTKSIAVSDESDIEQKKVDEKSDAKCTCDTNTDNAYKHAWNCPVFLEQLKKDCTCDSEDEKVTSHDFECEAFKKAITEICTCETKDTPGMHDNCEVIRRMHDELCNCGRKYDSVDDIIDNHEKDSNVVTYLMKWADYANQPEIIATTYTIKYNLNGGSISGQKTKYTSTTATFTLPTPRRTGYTFTGWTGTGLSSATKTVTIKKGSKGNRTYTAHWSVNNYRFDINGWLDGQDMTYITGYGTMDVYLNGSMFANDVGDFCDNYPYGTTYTITDIKPTPGHTYNGVQSGSLSGTIGAGVTKVSLNFTSNHYRLTLNPNGGAFSDGSTGARALTGADLIYGHGNWNNLAGNPVTRYNCNFAGWYTAPSGGTKLYDANGACLESSYWSNNQYYGTSDLTVYAQWYPYVHTVAYNANGGTGAPASQTKTYLVQLNLSTTKPIRTGYTFASWNTAADGSGTKWNPGDNYTPDYNGGTVTLYAQWTKDTYTISYNLNGGKISGQKTSYDVTTEAFTLPTPVRGGYTFSGWTGTGLSSATKTVTVAKGSAGNRSYTANWSAKIYTIYFDYNKPETDGTVGGAGTTSKSVRFDSTYGALPSPSLDGYTFDGWYTAASNGIKISSGTTYKTGGSTRLYAHWTLNTYSISYTLNGGSISGQPTSYNVNTATFTLPIPTRVGYIFTGWTGSNGTTAQKSVSIAKNSTGNKSYTANWTVRTHNIKYVLNGGTISNQPTSYNINTETFTIPKPTRAGYNFNGWMCTFESENGAYYAKQLDTVTITKGTIEDITCEASWSIINYSIGYNLSGGTISGQKTSYNVTTEAFALPTPSRNGHTFTGWTGTGLSSATKSVTVAKGSTGNRSYTANWSLNTYTISYTLNGGNISGQKTSYNVTTEAFALPTPSRNGYTFTGWTGTGLSSATKSVTVAKGSTGNKNYTANWSANKYTVSFNYNKPTTDGTIGNAGTTSKAVTFNSTYGTLPAPTLNGYTFAGWYTAATNGTKVSDTTKYTTAGNSTLYAHWNLNTYSISYTLNGGSVSGQPTSYNVNTATFTLPTPTKTGYTFTGWTGSNGTTAQKSISITKNNTGNKSYTANWSINSYYLDLNGTLDGASVSNISGYGTADVYIDGALKESAVADFYQQFAYGSKYEIKNIKATAGHTYNGVQSGSLTGTIGAGNVAVSLKFTSNAYTVSFNYNKPTTDGTIGNTGTTNKAVTFNSTYGTMPVPTLNGYTFAGWYTAATNGAKVSDTTKYTTAGNSTLYAHWNLNTYSIGYNLNGGSISGQPTSYNVNTATFALPAPTRAGYSFTGWTGSNGTTAQKSVSIAKNSTGNKSYTANWSLNTYTISYTLNGGNISGQKTSYNVTTEAFALPTPSRNGYTFTGWTGTGLSSATKSVTVAKGSTGNRSYTANWSANKYTVSYNGNGGSGSMSQDTATYGESYTAKANSFSRPGYAFTGWNESADGNGSDWTSWIGKPWTWTYIRNITLYAQWTKNTYSISYTLNGGSISGQKTSYDVTTEAFALPTPSRNGYTFTGWTGTGLSSATKSVTVAKGSTGNRSYTANWSANGYTVSFNYNKPTTDGTIGNAGTTNKAVTFNSTYGTLPAPTLNGYTFAGWYTAATNGTKVSDTTKYTTAGNSTLYVHWNLNTYSIGYNLNGGSISGQPTSYNVNTATFTLPAPTRAGYSFTGWTGSNGTTVQKSVSIAKSSTGNKSYTANWSLNTYTISYTLNGGNISGQKTSYNVTTEAFALPTPSRNGYTFTGWTGTGLSSATKTVTVAKGSTGNRSYTANWSANVLTINYHNDGATGFKWSDDSKYDDITGKDIILTEKYSYDSEYGPVYGLPNTSRLYKIGYHYDGYWYLDKKNSSVKVSDQLKLPKTQDVANAFGKLTDFEKGNTTIDVYASLIPNILTVNYYPNGATKIDKSNDEDGSDIIDIDSNVVYKTEEFKYDTEMRHWGLDDSRRFIRAGYHSENTYTVDSYDSKVSLNAGSGIYANTQDMAKTAGKLTDLENGNVTINIYAYWIPNTYVIKYNGNGSTSGSMTDSSCTYDTAFSLSKNTFSRKGYLFCGWNTQSDGKGTPYKDNESIKNLSSENEKTIILYAQWTPIKYTVKYDANGGTGEVPADTTHTFNEKGTVYPENALAKNTFTRKGYKFSGWNASRVKDGKIEWYYDNWNWYEEGKNPKSASKYVWADEGDIHNASDVDGDILTMHAQWKANTLTINYHNDSGTTWRQYPDDSTIDVSNKDIVQSETVTYDEKYNHYEFGLIDAGRLTKAGYHSNNGWKINSMDSKTIVPDTNGSMNSYENSGKGVADFLGVLTGFEKGDVTVDLYPDIAINTGTVHYYPNSNEAVAKAGYDQYITNGEFAGSLATTTSFDYKTTGGSGANTLTDVYTLFERKGYHQSAAQNWHYGSPDSDVYFHCDEEDLSPYVKDATDVHLKLYANWISNDYAVKFDGNGSTSGSMTDVACKYDESFNLTENKFIRNNYEFIGWNTKKDGSGQDYKDKESVKNLTDEDNGTVTLYAQWKLNEYTLTVSHTISGNMGNRDKDFSFTMSLSNSNKDAVIPENIEAVFMDDIGNKSKKLFTVVDEKVTFTLSHKESLIFKDIPYGTLYTISEDNENEYDVTNESASGTITKNIEVSFVSTKNGTVPTSSDTPNLYPIIMIAFAGIIYVILSQRKKKIKQKR